MARTIALLRHGKASGQAPDAVLLPEGRAHLHRLGRHLASEGWRPVRIVTSPYRRALETAALVGDLLGLSEPATTLSDLVPESEPDDALTAVLAAIDEADPVLVVAHLPLLDRLLHHLTGEFPGFAPGTFAEVELDGTRRGRLRRMLHASDLPLV